MTFTDSVPKFDVSSSDYTKAGVYSLVVSGYQGPYTSNVVSITISLTVIDPCLTATYSTTNVANQLYKVKYPNLAITIPAFTSDWLDSKCGAFTYTAIMNGGAPLDSPFTFNYGGLVLNV